MKKFKLFLCGLIAIAFAACTNDDPLQEELIICKLPDGTTFNEACSEAFETDIELIKFEANSSRSTTNGTQIGSSTAYAIVEGNCLYVYTPDDMFEFHQDCSGMFDNCGDEVRMIDFGNCIDTSNVTDMYEMFAGCYSLESLDLSKFNTSNVTKMNLMFYSCNSLESLDLSNFNTSNVTKMNQMFNFCNSLKSLDLSNFNTSNVTDMRSMFSGCNSLESLNLCSFTFNANTDIDSMFMWCTNLNRVYVKNTSDRDILRNGGTEIPNGSSCIRVL